VRRARRRAGSALFHLHIHSRQGRFQSVDAYSLTIEKTPAFLMITAHGMLTWETDGKIDEEVGEACIRHAADRVIIDISAMQGRLSVYQNHEAAKTLFERMRGTSLRRIAVVDRVEHQERSEMYEMTAQNRGMSIQFFPDLTSAQQWIRSA
jgi:hypothetical protein